jgi:hypothetical protein
VVRLNHREALINASLRVKYVIARCALDELNPEPVRAVGAGLPANRVLAAPELFAGKPAPTGRTVPPGFVTAKRGEMLAMTNILNESDFIVINKQVGCSCQK